MSAERVHERMSGWKVLRLGSPRLITDPDRVQQLTARRKFATVGPRVTSMPREVGERRRGLRAPPAHMA